MNNIISKDKYNTFLNKFKLSIGQQVYIHHNITEDLIVAIVKKVYADSVILSIPEDSPYFGQPDWKVKKTMIVGVI